MNPTNADEIKKCFLQDEPAVQTETVFIGGMPFVIQGIKNPSILIHIQKEAEARMRAPSLLPVTGKSRNLEREEILFYTWLEYGLVEPKLNFEEIVHGSENYGLDCLSAGIQVARLSKALPEEVEEPDPFSERIRRTEGGGGSL